MGYDPNEPRDAEGKWTDSGDAIRKAASDKYKDPKDVAEIERQKEVHNYLKERAKTIGLQAGNVTVSNTEYGISTYTTLKDNQGNEIKVRSSDHQVQSNYRIQSEVHIQNKDDVDRFILNYEKIHFKDRFIIEDIIVGKLHGKKYTRKL